MIITKGKWHATFTKSAPDESASGAWRVVAGTVQIKDWLWGDSIGTATGAPSSLGDASAQYTLPWVYKPGADSVADDPMSVRFEWTSSTKTMTIHGTDADENPLLIKARRS